MPRYRVVWTVDVDVEGDHRAAAQACARHYFQSRIADGDPDSACVFEVTGPNNRPAIVDLAPSLCDLIGDDTE